MSKCLRKKKAATFREEKDGLETIIFFCIYIKKSNEAVGVPDSIDIAFINGGIGYTQSLLIHLKKIRITKKILNIVNVEYVV